MDFINRGHMLADVSAIIGSLDIVFLEIDRWASFSPTCRSQDTFDSSLRVHYRKQYVFAFAGATWKT
jgi:hypothetical protein